MTSPSTPNEPLRDQQAARRDQLGELDHPQHDLADGDRLDPPSPGADDSSGRVRGARARLPAGAVRAAPDDDRGGRTLALRDRGLCPGRPAPGHADHLHDVAVLPLGGVPRGRRGRRAGDQHPAGAGHRAGVHAGRPDHVRDHDAPGHDAHLHPALHRGDRGEATLRADEHPGPGPGVPAGRPGLLPDLRGQHAGALDGGGDHPHLRHRRHRELHLLAAPGARAALQAERVSQGSDPAPGDLRLVHAPAPHGGHRARDERPALPGALLELDPGDVLSPGLLRRDEVLPHRVGPHALAAARPDRDERGRAARPPAAHLSAHVALAPVVLPVLRDPLLALPPRDLDGVVEGALRRLERRLDRDGAPVRQVALRVPPTDPGPDRAGQGAQWPPGHPGHRHRALHGGPLVLPGARARDGRDRPGRGDAGGLGLAHAGAALELRAPAHRDEVLRVRAPDDHPRADPRPVRDTGLDAGLVLPAGPEHLVAAARAAARLRGVRVRAAALLPPTGRARGHRQALEQASRQGVGGSRHGSYGASSQRPARHAIQAATSSGPVRQHPPIARAPARHQDSGPPGSPVSVRSPIQRRPSIS